MPQQTSLKNIHFSAVASQLFNKVFKKTDTVHHAALSNLEFIRQGLLQVLEKYELRAVDNVYDQVIEAADVEQLWYLRSDVMVVISRKLGEQTAKSELSEINAMFRGILPKGFITRPSPLDH
jgi:hypothetical protein